jgi:hypothetical protein
MIRLGENALFRLDRAPVIVRIARSVEYLEAARLEVRIASWLAAEGSPAARIMEERPTPKGSPWTCDDRPH